eukprot:1990679-Pleurochrysis_carterae.AAC.1
MNNTIGKHMRETSRDDYDAITAWMRMLWKTDYESPRRTVKMQKKGKWRHGSRRNDPTTPIKQT